MHWWRNLSCINKQEKTGHMQFFIHIFNLEELWIIQNWKSINDTTFYFLTIVNDLDMVRLALWSLIPKNGKCHCWNWGNLWKLIVLYYVINSYLIWSRCHGMFLYFTFRPSVLSSCNTVSLSMKEDFVERVVLSEILIVDVKPILPVIPEWLLFQTCKN